MGPPRAHGPTEALLGLLGTLKLAPSSREAPQGLPGTYDLLCSGRGRVGLGLPIHGKTSNVLEVFPHMGRLPIHGKSFHV